MLVGAGPTGVEMAGAIAVLVRNTLRSEFRRINPESAKIILLDMAPRILGPFSEELAQAAKERLESLGVEVRLGHSVDQIDAGGVLVDDARIASNTVIWIAGVAPSPAGKWLKVETDRAGEYGSNAISPYPGIRKSLWSAILRRWTRMASHSRAWRRWRFSKDAIQAI